MASDCWYHCFAATKSPLLFGRLPNCVAKQQRPCCCHFSPQAEGIDGTILGRRKVVCRERSYPVDISVRNALFIPEIHTVRGLEKPFLGGCGPKLCAVAITPSWCKCLQSHTNRQDVSLIAKTLGNTVPRRGSFVALER